jgi:hypothetical protein
MPRRSILSAVERDRFLTISDTKDDLIQHYTLSESDLSLVRLHRGAANLPDRPPNIPQFPPQPHNRRIIRHHQ